MHLPICSQAIIALFWNIIAQIFTGYRWDCLQMRWKNNLILIGVPAFIVSSCGIFGSQTGEAQTRKSVVPAQAPVSQTETRAVDGSSAQPALSDEKVNYDEVGYASWYGDELRGNVTASGEIFNPDGVSAAHKTLPLPSFAEVTNLDTGRTILVRINDRGPFKRGRIIDISAGAAKQLGVTTQGQFPVRVRRVNPPEFERRQLQSGGTATERLTTPPALLAALRRNLKPDEASPTVASAPDRTKPSVLPPAAIPSKSAANNAGAQFDPPDTMAAKPMTKPASPLATKPVSVAIPAPVVSNKMAPASTIAQDYFVQIGAFSNKARADALAKKAGATVVSAGNIWRVRFGPYEDESGARTALGPLAAKGYRDARVTR
jgi:rare lipoprotein A